MDEISSIFNKQLNLSLSRGLPAGSWLRDRGRTRVLVIDDDIFERRHLFTTGGSNIERAFEERLNVEVQFFSMPEGYDGGPARRRGLFTVDWFTGELERRLSGRSPISAIVLDLRFGLEDLGNPDQPIGAIFLQILDENRSLRAQGVPVIIASSIQEDPGLHDFLKTFGSYKSFIQKTSDVNLPEELFRALVQWALLTDPLVSAFSAPMRTVARSLRQIAINPRYISYENDSSLAGVKPAALLAPVVFTGDVGSGKNFLASKLVEMSERAHRHFDTFTFPSASTREAAVSELFGTGPNSASQNILHFVHPPTGFFLDADAGKEKCFRVDLVGKVHRADVGTRRYSLREVTSGKAEPECGTLVLDELPEVPEEYQVPLLEVLNHGRFTPHLGSTIPIRRERGAPPGDCYRQLDVWFLFTCTKDGWENRLRLDLKSRLGRYNPIEVPRLPDREADIVPLAVGMIIAALERCSDVIDSKKMERLKMDSSQSPEAVYKTEALTLLDQLGRFASVRQLNGIIEQLPNITHVVPFNRREIEIACRQAGVSLNAPQSSADLRKPSELGPEISSVIDWMTNAPLGDLELQIGSRPPGPSAMASAASVLLAQLDHALQDEFAGKRLEEMSTVPAASLWKRLWGESLEHNKALSRIADLMTLDPVATKRRASESPFLRWLLRSKQMSVRSKTFQDLAIDFERTSTAPFDGEKEN